MTSRCENYVPAPSTVARIKVMAAAYGPDFIPSAIARRTLIRKACKELTAADGWSVGVHHEGTINVFWRFQRSSSPRRRHLVCDLLPVGD